MYSVTYQALADAGAFSFSEVDAMRDARSEVLVNRALMWAALAVVCHEVGAGLACAACAVMCAVALVRSL